jgi:gliding-associated putative ABC transporter substrate-binding component GldG
MERNWTSRTALALVGAILIVVNLIGLNWFGRLDLTDDRVYSLSDASIDLVESLDDPVTVKAFFTRDLPAPYSSNRRFLKDKLDEYRAFGGNRFQYEFIDPAETDDGRADAERFRIPPVQIQVVENDNLQIKNAYMGLAIQYEDQREVIPVVQELSNLEYDITTAIRRMKRDELPVIGFLQGHGEPDPEETMKTWMEALRRNSDPNTVSIVGGRIDPQPDALLVVAPTDTIPDDHLVAIDAFVQQGGRAAFLVNRVEADLQRGFGTPLSVGLERLLDSYGIRIAQDLVMDAQNSRVNAQRQAGFFTVVEAIEYPFFPIATSFSDNVMVRRLNDLRFFFVSSIDTSATPASVSVEPLAFSTEASALQTGFFMLQPQAVQAQNLNDGPFVLAAAYSGSFPSPFAEGSQSVDTRIIAIGDADLLNESLAGPIPSSIEFGLNMVDWLVLDEDILAIRSKKIDPRPLDPVEDRTKPLVKYFTMLFPPFLVVLLGVMRWRRRRLIASLP